MKLNDLSPAPGSRREKHRPGRGIGSGLGKTGEDYDHTSVCCGHD